MNALRLLPVVLALWVLAAHFMRTGMLPLTALLFLLPALLFVRRMWAVRALQVVLVLGAVEWALTGADFVAQRMDMGRPWTRLALIMGGVTLWTLGSAAILQTRKVRARYLPPPAG